MTQQPQLNLKVRYKRDLPSILIDRGLSVIVIQGRYTAGSDHRMIAIFGNDACHESLAAMADAMTASGEYCQHLENRFYETEYYPFAYAPTPVEAIQQAAERFFKAVEGIHPKVAEEALRLVSCSTSEYTTGQYHEKYIEVPPLASLEDIAKELGVPLRS